MRVAVFARLAYGLLILFAGVVIAACDDPLALLPAINENRVDTLSLFALQNTPVASPSAFDILSGDPVRTDQRRAFDFAFDMDAVGTPFAIPPGALGLPPEPGVLPSDSAFEAIRSAPLEGYITDQSVPLGLGSVFVVRSRLSFDGCGLTGSLPRYGKFRILALDQQARTVTLEVLVNRNCGYRSLEPGLPTS